MQDADDYGVSMRERAMLEDWTAGHLALVSGESGYPQLTSMRLLEVRKGKEETAKEVSGPELDDIDARTLVDLLVSPALGRPGRWRLQAVILRSGDVDAKIRKNEDRPVRGFSVVRLADDGTEWHVPSPPKGAAGGQLGTAEARMVQGFGDQISRAATSASARADVVNDRLWAYSNEVHERELATHEEFRAVESDLNLKCLQLELENEALREQRDEWPPEVRIAIAKELVPRLGTTLDVVLQVVGAAAARIGRPPGPVIDMRRTEQDERLERLERLVERLVERLPAPEATT